MMRKIKWSSLFSCLEQSRTGAKPAGWSLYLCFWDIISSFLLLCSWRIAKENHWHQHASLDRANASFAVSVSLYLYLDAIKGRPSSDLYLPLWLSLHCIWRRYHYCNHVDILIAFYTLLSSSSRPHILCPFTFLFWCLHCIDIIAFCFWCICHMGASQICTLRPFFSNMTVLDAFDASVALEAACLQT